MTAGERVETTNQMAIPVYHEEGLRRERGGGATIAVPAPRFRSARCRHEPAPPSTVSTGRVERRGPNSQLTILPCLMTGPGPVRSVATPY